MFALGVAMFGSLALRTKDVAERVFGDRVFAPHVLGVDWGDFFLDIVLPETDKGAIQQTVVMGIFWPVVIFLTRKQQRDIKHFVWGCAMLNLAWFGARMIH